MIRSFLVLTVSLFTFSASADVWTVSNRWDLDWEQRYSNWVGENVQLDIFSNKQSPWYGFKTDCADAVYAIRIIFAYENKLPVMFRNSHNSSELMTEKMTKWDSLEEKARVRAFIDYVMEYTGTYSMPNDTYPITISPNWVRPGALYLQPKQKPVAYIPSVLTNGHVYVVKNVTAGGTILYMGSTVPRDIRALSTRYDNPMAPIKSDGGFRAWRWPENYSNSAQMPGYSLEQFKLLDWSNNLEAGNAKILRWHGWVKGKLMVRKETLDERVDQAIYNVCAQLKERILIIQSAQDAIRAQGGKCLRDTAWEDFSTPSRDKRILEDFQKLRSLVGQKYNSWDLASIANHPRACRYEIVPGKTWALDKFYSWSEKWKSDPNYSPEGRWGLTTRGGTGIDCER